jgi:outer membrane protein assembly factor BamB
MKRSLSCFLGFLLVCSLAAAEGAVTPKLKWSFATRGKIYAPPLLTDLDADGKQEVVVCASREKSVICLDSAGEQRWSFFFDDGGEVGLQAALSAIDYDGDGKQEVFFATKAGTVGCLAFTGKLIWSVSLNDTIDYSGPLLADVDGDFRLEIVIGADSGRLYCLNDAGGVQREYKGDGPVRGIPCFEFDPRSRKIRIHAVFGGGQEVCLNGEGEALWTFNEPSLKKTRFCTPALGYVDRDFDLDVVSVTDNMTVIVRDAATGVEKWRWVGNSSIDQTNSVALADFDNRNRVDVVCADGTGQGGAGHVYRLTDGGKLLWSADVGGAVVQGPVVADVDGDSKLEILVCSRSKRLICLGADGKEKWSFPSGAEAITSPAVGDIDGDGLTEIVFTSKDRSVYCLTVDGAYKANLAPWPMISRDPQLSGNPSGTMFATPTMSAPPNYPEVDIKAISSIHMGENTIKVMMSNILPRPRRLEGFVGLKTPDGEWIERRFSQDFGILQCYDISLDFTALYPGEYILMTNLTDVGQAITTSADLKKIALDPAADIDPEITSAMRAREYLFREMPEGPARAALEPACAQAVDHWNAAMEELRAVIARPEATKGERKAALEKTKVTGAEIKDVFGRLHCVRATAASKPDFGFVAEDAMRKIFKDEPALRMFTAGRIKPQTVEISLCRNESETAQVVIVPALMDLKNLRVSVPGDLAHVGGGDPIPASDIIINRVGYVQIGPSEYNWCVEKQGEYPDVLFPNDPIDIPLAQVSQPYFVTLKARDNTAPGDYEGALRAEADGFAPVEIPFKVHIWNFEIPEKPHFKVSIWMDENWLKAFYKYPERTPLEVRKRFYQFHLDHRISPLHIFPEGGGDKMEDFDYVMANGQNAFFTPIPEYLPEADRPAAAEKLLSTRALLQQKGWEPFVQFYSMDEAAVMRREAIPQMVDMNNWAKSVIPEWPRLETSAPEKSMFGAVDIWCPTIDNFNPKVLSDRIAQGDKSWLYTVWGRPGLMIEFPGVDHRLMFWACYKYGAEGFLYWGSTHWDLNCEGEERWPAKPWIPYNRQPGHNGCGYLIYPGPDGVPYSSIRLELVREGIEDYEYLYLLRELIKSVGDKAPQDLRARAEAEVATPTEVFMDQKDFTSDPKILEDARKRIALLIEQLTALAGK